MPRRLPAVAIAALLFALIATVARDGWSSPTFAVAAAFFTSAYVVSAGHLMGYRACAAVFLRLATRAATSGEGR